jgi:hypothetical protein
MNLTNYSNTFLRVLKVRETFLKNKRFRFSFFIMVIFLFVEIVLNTTHLYAQNDTSTQALFKVRIVDLDTALCKGYGGRSICGIILEIENIQPNLNLVLDAASIKVSNKYDISYSPLLMFYVDILKGSVEPTTIKGTQLEGKEITIGNKIYEAYSSMKKMAIPMEFSGGMAYNFKDISVLQLAFIFPVGKSKIKSLDFLKQTIDLTRTPLKLTGEWFGDNSWLAMNVNISFNVDKNSMFLNNTKVTIECKAGEPKTKVELVNSSDVRINKDGTFQIPFNNTNTILKGKFAAPNQVSGEIKGGLSALCGKEKVNIVGKWKITK